MSFDLHLAERIRVYLSGFPRLKVTEKKMFGGLAFMVNGKMCINVSGQKLMCRFDQEMHEDIFERKGVEKMIMKGKELKGYCYVTPIGFKSSKDFEYWITLCLSYNEKAKLPKTKK